mmetsp:Transcript_6569/g.12105  ORF Transcript_6569/g.12105 Transcript_6569/m.12105 type:complete len:86 (-) Transcript_6569:103-360(-)
MLGVFTLLGCIILGSELLSGGEEVMFAAARNAHLVVVPHRSAHYQYYHPDYFLPFVERSLSWKPPMEKCPARKGRPKPKAEQALP